MIVRIITCRVKAGMEEEFESATTANHRASLAEPGVLRFDVLKDSAEQGTYYLYEAYRDTAATELHKETKHYRTWREVVAPCMKADRSSVACSVVAPSDEAAWKT